MRIKLAYLTFAAAGMSIAALPASAQQSYNSACNKVKSDRQAMGAVLGGLAGGLIGNQSAGRGARDEGTALGLVVGGLVGSQLAKGDINCPSNVYTGSQYSAGAPNYGYDTYGGGYPQDPYAGGYNAYPTVGTRYGDNYRYGSSGYGNSPVYDAPSRRTYNHRKIPDYSNSHLAGGPAGSYNGDYDFAGRECAGAKQITKLPDGTEIHRPVEACREAYYGEWSVED